MGRIGAVSPLRRFAPALPEGEPRVRWVSVDGEGREEGHRQNRGKGEDAPVTKVGIEGWDNGFALRMEGHAGYGKEGADPLCGGLSVLAYTMAEFIGRLEAEGKLSEKPILSLSSGQAFLRAVAKKEFSQELHVGLTLIQGGFSLLAQSYPLWVELTVLENSGSL